MRPLVALLALAVAALAAAGAGARPAATADLSVKWVGPQPAKPTVGTIVVLGASIVNGGPDRSHARVNIEVPSGAERVGGTLECTTPPPLMHCDELDAPVGDDGTGTVTFRMSKPGSYTFVVSLDELAAADPDTSNNSDSVTVTVSQPVAAGAVRLTPPHPRAGRTFVASVAVTGAAVSGVRCTTSVGRATPERTADNASCAVTTPRSAAGRVVSGVVTATAGKAVFARRFSVRLR